MRFIREIPDVVLIILNLAIWSLVGYGCTVIY